MLKGSSFLLIITLLLTIFTSSQLFAQAGLPELAAAEGQFAGNCPDKPSIAAYDSSVSGMLVTDMVKAAGDKVTIVERERLKDLLAEQCLYDILDKSSAAKHLPALMEKRSLPM